MDLKDLKVKIINNLEYLRDVKAECDTKILEAEKQLFAVDQAILIAEEMEFEESIDQSERELGVWFGKPYADSNQEDAVLDVLTKASEALSPARITQYLIKGGYAFRTDKPTNSIYVLLNRLEKDQKVEREGIDNRVCFKLPSDEGEEPEFVKSWPDEEEEVGITDEDVPFERK